MEHGFGSCAARGCAVSGCYPGGGGAALQCRVRQQLRRGHHHQRAEDGRDRAALDPPPPELLVCLGRVGRGGGGRLARPEVAARPPARAHRRTGEMSDDLQNKCPRSAPHPAQPAAAPETGRETASKAEQQRMVTVVWFGSPPTGILPIGGAGGSASATSFQSAIEGPGSGRGAQTGGSSHCRRGPASINGGRRRPGARAPRRRTAWRTAAVGSANHRISSQ